MGRVMRELRDFYWKKARRQGYPARSVFKLEEAQQKYRLLGRHARVLDLGCWPGSWSMYAARAVGPRGLVVGVDLQAGRLQPVAGGAPIRTERADVMDEAVLAVIARHARRFDVVLSDMAPRTTGSRWADQQHSLRLARRVLELARRVLRPGGNMYVKVFEGEDFREFVQEARRLFATVRTFKPKSSRKESREVFVLGLRKKGGSGDAGRGRPGGPAAGEEQPPST